MNISGPSQDFVFLVDTGRIGKEVQGFLFFLTPTGHCYCQKRLSKAAAMTTRGAPAALPLRPVQGSVTPGSATPPGAGPGQATTAMPHSSRNHTQKSTPPSKVALIRSWVGRTKLYLGAAIGVLTLIVTIISLLPSFAGGRYGKEALELARWTARKDFLEACRMVSRFSNPGWFVMEVVAAKNGR